jgi:PAS domain S-box-containing protein
MTGARRLLTRIVLVALLYAAVGRLALLMAIPPGYATAVWPSAGLALGAVLLWGYWTLPGILLGSFLINVGTSIESSSSVGLSRALFVAAGLAIGAALQAAAGATLIRRGVGFPTPLGRERELGIFLILGGPVACLVSATVGSAVLLGSREIEADEFWYGWFTWWVGDTIGVLLLAPVVLLSGALPRGAWRSSGLVVALPILIGTVTVVSFFVFASKREQESIVAEFQLRTDRLVDAVRRDVTSYVEVMHATAAFFAAVEKVDGAAFRELTARACARHPGLRALAFLPIVPADARTVFEERVARDIPEFRVLEQDSSGTLRPAGERQELAPVRYVEPLTENRTVLGFDFLSDPTRRDVLRRARELGSLAVSSHVELIRPKGSEATGVIAAMSLPSGGVELPAGGFVIGIFVTKDILEHAIRGLPHPGIDVDLVDERSPAALLASVRRDVSRSAGTSRELRLDAPVEFGGRRWSLRFSAGETYLSDHRGWQAWAVLAVGMLFTSLLGAFLVVVTGKAVAVADLVRERTAQLESRNELFQRLTDAVISVGGDLRIKAWNPGAERMYGYSADEVIGQDPRPLFRTIYPDGATADEVFKRLMERGTWAGELIQHTRDGRALNVLVSASAPKDDSGRFLGIVSVNRDVTAMRDAERRLVSSLMEKEVLLKEVHHRVKNNLQVISSLLSLQAHHVSDSTARELLAESQSRVQSIALVHERLYRAADLSHVDLQNYASDLVNGLLRTHLEVGARITCAVELTGVRLPIDLAIPCGLIVNELVINSLKYAFADGHGSIRISGRQEDGRVTLVVADDGVGLPRDLDPSRAASLGLELVFTFAEQLGAAVTWSREGGTTFQFVFREDHD